MSQRSDFQIQILEKLGAPLLVAAAGVAARTKKDGQGQGKQEAESVAELLGKAVQASIALAGSMDIKDTGGQGDSVRLALAAVVGPLVASQYSLTAKMPGDKEIGRLVKALEAVLIFSDNFAPVIENTARLENIEAGARLADENQINIQLVNMLVPVINVVASFPFGQLESKLVQDVVGKLVRRAVVMREAFVVGTDEKVSKQAELNILKALAVLYAECHQEEVNKLMAMNEQEKAAAAEAAGGVLSMDPVWQAFEIRAAMVEVICKSAMPVVDGAAAAVPPVPVVQPVEVVVPPEAVVEAAPEAKPEAESGGAFNPMGMFKPGTKVQAEDTDKGGVA